MNSNILAFALCLVGSFLSAAPVYWVGNGGNWSDEDHWSFTSGGAGGAGTPGTADDAIFDANSFTMGGQEVLVDVNIVINNMDWSSVSNNPSLTGSDAFEIVIGSSLAFSPDMTHNFSGNYTFSSTSTGLTITSAGQTFNREVIFRSGGEWTLQDALTVDIAIQIIEGSFISNNQSIDVFTFFSDSQLNRNIQLGNSIVRINQRIPGTGSSLIIGGDNLAWDAGNATFEFNGTSSSMMLSGLTQLNFGNVTFFSENSTITSTSPTPPTFDALQFMLNGEIIGDLIINDWTLTMGQTVFLSNGSRQMVSDIITGDDCDGLAGLMVRNNIGANSTIEFDFSPSSLSGLFLKGVEGDSPDGRTILLFGSQDGGGNGNIWQFQDLVPRDLYWVGGTGDWNDKDNWASSSGGAGGECIPKPNDNIFFDNNSFTASTDVVSGITPAYANNITWNAPSFPNVEINLPELYINNDLTLLSLINWSIRDVYLVGNDEAGNSSNTDFQIINTGPNALINLIMQSNRNVVLDAPLTLSGELNLSTAISGNRFDSDQFNITAQSIVADNNPITLILDGSQITITGPRMGLEMPVTLFNIGSLSGSSTSWEFTAEDSGIESDRGPLGDLNFTGETGLAVIFSNGVLNTNSITFAGNGQLSGEEIETTLLNLSPGRSYTFDTNTEHNIGFNIIAPGTICSPISIMSNVVGAQANIITDALFETNMQYINIRDIAISGASEIQAGLGSADLGNNSGWTFPSNEENDNVQKFLGRDQMACEDEVIILQPFQTSEISRIVWVNDSSQTLIFRVDNTIDEVIATAFFPDGCSLTDTVAFDFQPNFTIDLGQDSTICEGENLILNASVTGATYQWNTGDTVAQIIPEATQEYIVNIERGGCTDADTVAISVIDIEDFSLPQDTTVCEALFVASPVISNGSFIWSDGTNSSSLVIAETSTVWVEVSQDRCSLRDSISVVIDPAFTLDIGNDTTICQGETLVLTPEAGLDSYIWSDGSTDPMLTVNSSGTYNLKAERGVCRDSVEININVNELPDFSIGQDITRCEGDSVIISMPAGISLPSVWSDGTSTPSLTIANSGTYWLEIQEDNCTRRDSLDAVFEVSFELDLGADQTACEGDTILLDATMTNADSYSWNDGSIDASLSVTTSDDYILMANRGACTETDTVRVTYLDLDALNLGTDVTSCMGETITFDASLPGVTDYQWTEIGTGISASTNAEINVTMDGTYAVIASSQGCSTSDTIGVIFDTPIPFTSLGVDTTLCEGDELNFDLTIPNVNLMWSDGSTNPIYSISDPGTYSVELMRGGCLESDTILVQSRAVPMANLIDTERACQGSTVTIDATTPGVEYDWSTMEHSPIINVTIPGLYIVTITDDQCSSIDSTEVIFVSAPTIALPADTTICDGDALILDPMPDTSEPLSYLWNSGEESQTINADVAGIYSVAVTNDDNCTSVDSFALSVNESPTFTLPDTSSACEGEAATLTVMVTSDDFIWSTAETSPSIEVNTSSIVWAEAAIGNCVFRDSTQVIISPIPVIELPVDTVICEGMTLNLDASVTNGNYTWSTGETTAEIVVMEEGNYTVEVSVNGCSTTGMVRLDIDPIPVIELGDNQAICAGETVNLDAGGGAWTTMWSTGESTPQITVSESSTISVIADLNGCTTEDEVMISVEPLPEFDLGEDISRCDQFATTLVVNRNDVDVLWNTGDIGTSLQVNEEGTFVATAMTDLGCVFTDAITVRDRECRRFSLYVPNIFAPESQGANNLFYVSPSENATIISYNISVFDRWGNQLFESQDINAQWDGRTSTHGLQPGVYTYAIEVRYSDDFEDDRTDYISGDFTIVR